MIKVTLKNGTEFNADDSKAAYYQHFGAKVEIINMPEVIKTVGRKKIKI